MTAFRCQYYIIRNRMVKKDEQLRKKKQPDCPAWTGVERARATAAFKRLDKAIETAGIRPRISMRYFNRLLAKIHKE